MNSSVLISNSSGLIQGPVGANMKVLYLLIIGQNKEKLLQINFELYNKKNIVK